MPRHISKKRLAFGVGGLIPLNSIRENMAQYAPPEDLHIIESHFSKVPVLVAGIVHGDASGGHLTNTLYSGELDLVFAPLMGMGICCGAHVAIYLGRPKPLTGESFMPFSTQQRLPRKVRLSILSQTT